MLSRWKTIERIEAISKKHNVTVTQEQGTLFKKEKITFTAPSNKIFKWGEHDEGSNTAVWLEPNLIGIIGYVKVLVTCLEEEQQQ